MDPIRRVRRGRRRLGEKALVAVGAYDVPFVVGAQAPEQGSASVGIVEDTIVPPGRLAGHIGPVLVVDGDQLVIHPAVDR